MMPPIDRLTARRVVSRAGSYAFAFLSLWLWATASAQDAQRPSVADIDTPGEAHEFYFTRGIYTAESNDYFGGERWAIDYPKADRQFLVALERLTNVDAYPLDNAVELTPEVLRRYPFVYVLEVGSINLTADESKSLKEYLLAGGFLVVDDFWGSWAWDTFERQMRDIFPDNPIVDVPADHPVFNIFYSIKDVIQVPNLYQGANSSYGGPTHEYDGYLPQVRGIFDDKGRLMVLINWNTDLGDAWEWADHPEYPLRFSTYAYEMGINFVIYAMTY